ncbi:MAG TPA: hypothetical protein VHM48_03605 [Candidatus Limnocylindrales bacterium]|nr:hypothetical protein [Candidatus Limnocylindrales bacterium]
MLDHSLEQKLRAALRTEGDDLAFTITSEELERRLALRRRGGLSPLASLGLAAAVGVGMLGLAAVVGGWFDPRPAVGPLPSRSAVVVQASPSATPSPAPSGGPLALPSLDELLGTIDPARVVRAEAVGPNGGLGDQLGAFNSPIEPNVVTFDPVATSGTYYVLAVCAGDGRVVMIVVRADGQSIEEVPITCDGARSLRQMGLEAGSSLQVTSVGHSGWRVVLLAPDRPAPHAATIDRGGVVPEGADVALEAESRTLEPDYTDILTGGGIQSRTEVGSLATRTRYDVYISCAGPTSVRYAFGGRRSSDEPVDPGVLIEYVAGEVECDGTLQHDVIELTLGGGDVSVTAEDRTVWRIVVTQEKPPIASAPDEGGWTLSSGGGPNLDINGQLEDATMAGNAAGGDIRIVVSCSGATTLDLIVDTGPVVGQRVDHLSVDCREGFGTVEKVYAKAGPYIEVTSDPHGVRTWIAITVQTR